MIEYRDMHLYVLLFYSRHFFCGSLNRRHFGASSYPGSHSPPLVRLSDQLDLSRRHPATEIHGNIHGYRSFLYPGHIRLGNGLHMYRMLGNDVNL